MPDVVAVVPMHYFRALRAGYLRANLPPTKKSKEGFEIEQSNS